MAFLNALFILESNNCLDLDTVLLLDDNRDVAINS